MWQLVAAWLWGGAGVGVEPADESVGEGPDGAELFRRVWMEGDERSTLGDGLGPTFNARSCAECHQQGGAGGAGGAHTSVRLRLERGRTQVVHRHAPLVGPRPPLRQLWSILGEAGDAGVL